MIIFTTNYNNKMIDYIELLKIIAATRKSIRELNRKYN